MDSIKDKVSLDIDLESIYLWNLSVFIQTDSSFYLLLFN